MLLIYFFVRFRFYKPSGPPSACFAANAPPAAFGKQSPAFKESGTTKPRATWVTRGFTFYEHDYLAELRQKPIISARYSGWTGNTRKIIACWSYSDCH